MDGVKATYTPICLHIGVHHSHCGVATHSATAIPTVSLSRLRGFDTSGYTAFLLQLLQTDRHLLQSSRRFKKNASSA